MVRAAIAYILGTLLVTACSTTRSSPASNAATPSPEERSAFRTLDSIAFTSKGRSWELIVLEDTLADPLGTSEALRPLLLYERTDPRKRNLLLRNDSLVQCRNCGGMMGDPYQGVAFHEDSLIIFHYGGAGWRWAMEMFFIPTEAGEWPLVMQRNTAFFATEEDSTTQVEVLTRPVLQGGLRDASAYR